MGAAGLTRLVFAALFGALALSSEATEGPVAAWSFDGGLDAETKATGPVTFVPGVSGQALKCDGLSTFLARSSAGLPSVAEGFTIEAWIAPQEYSWNRTAVLNGPGYLLGIDDVGRVFLRVHSDGRWLECVSPDSIPLLRWSHIAGTFDVRNGLAVFVNGRQVAATPATGGLDTPPQSLDLLLGMTRERMSPSHTERQPSAERKSRMIFDGLVDEVRLYDRALSVEEIARSFQAVRVPDEAPLRLRRLPAIPPGPGGFGAFPTRLKYCDEWDRLWRNAGDPDIVVRFDDSPLKVVFWRGANYGMSWVNGADLWRSDQSLETWNANGCCEHMSDKQCRYSHASIVENTAARVVIHWRYALADIDYAINHRNPTGWGDWADEFITIYPDAVAARRQVVWSDQNRYQFLETIVFNQPGSRPQDTLRLDALTLANLRGESRTYSWERGYPRFDRGPADATIQIVNFREGERSFSVVENGSEPIRPFTAGALEGFSTFPCWNHWPVAQLPNDGRVAPVADRPSHTSLTATSPRRHPQPDGSVVAHTLFGLTDAGVEEIVGIARSWAQPPPLKIVQGEGVKNLGYDPGQRAYVLEWSPDAAPPSFTLELQASDDSPSINPAFVIRNWPVKTAAIQVGGLDEAKIKDIRQGFIPTDHSRNLVAWIKLGAHNPTSISFSTSESPRATEQGAK